MLEFQQRIKKQFESADANGDGAIDRDEWMARFGTDEDFDCFDLDGDGRVTAKEWEWKQELEKAKSLARVAMEERTSLREQVAELRAEVVPISAV